MGTFGADQFARSDPLWLGRSAAATQAASGRLAALAADRYLLASGNLGRDARRHRRRGGLDRTLYRGGTARARALRMVAAACKRGGGVRIRSARLCVAPRDGGANPAGLAVPHLALAPARMAAGLARFTACVVVLGVHALVQSVLLV